MEIGGTWLLFHNTDSVTLSGTGYLRLRWEVEYWKYAANIAIRHWTESTDS